MAMAHSSLIGRYPAHQTLILLPWAISITMAIPTSPLPAILLSTPYTSVSATAKAGFWPRRSPKGSAKSLSPGRSSIWSPQSLGPTTIATAKIDLYYIQCCGGFDVPFGAWGVLIGNGDGTFTGHRRRG